MRIPEGQKNLKKTECFGFGVVSDQSSSLVGCGFGVLGFVK
jgi:hypothetical protein